MPPLNNIWTLEYVAAGQSVMTGLEKALADWGFANPKLEFVSQQRSRFMVQVPGATNLVAAPPIPFEGYVVLRRNRTGSGTAWSGGQIVFQGRQTTRTGIADPPAPRDQLTFSDAMYDLENLVFQQKWQFNKPIVTDYFSRLNLFQLYSQPTAITSMVNGVRIVTITLAQGMTLNNGNSVSVFAVPSVGLDNLAFPVTVIATDGSGNATQVTIPAQISPATYAGGATLFANSQLQTNGQQIQNIIDYANSAGVQIQSGTIDLNWELPIYPVRCVSCMSAIEICLKATPDAVHWIDYTAIPPTFNCRQRPNLTALSLPYADGIRHVSSEIVPRYDLQPTQVVLQYQRTDTINGQPVSSKATDVIGTPDNGGPVSTDDTLVTGKKVRAMVVAIDLRGVAANELSVKVTSSAIPTFIDPGPPVNLTVPTLAWWTQKKQSLGAKDITNLAYVPASLVVVDDNGNDYSLTWQNLFPNEHVDGEIDTWMGKTCITVTVKADFTYVQSDDSDRILAKIGSAKPHNIQVRVKLTNSGPGVVTYQTLQSFVSGETPPVGLAANIFNSLSILAHEGRHEILDPGFDVASVIPGPQYALNLTGGMAEWATMLATIQSCELDLVKKRATISFGPPKHIAPGDMEELLQFWRYRVVYDNPNLRISADPSIGKSQLGGQTNKENTEHSNPNEGLKTHAAPNPASGNTTFIQHDAFNQLIVLKVIDPTGTIIPTKPYIRIALGDAFSSDTPPVAQNMFIQEWTVCLADGSQARALFLSSAPYGKSAGPALLVTSTSPAPTFYSRSLPLGNGVTGGVVSGLGLSFGPVRAIATVSRPAGGLILIATVDPASITTDGFTFQLSGMTDSANYVLDYILIPGP
jgi:hypothetical protein